MKGPCPNYFVRRNLDVPIDRAWEVVRDNGGGEKAYPVAQFGSEEEAIKRCLAIRERTQARQRFLSGNSICD